MGAPVAGRRGVGGVSQREARADAFNVGYGAVLSGGRAGRREMEDRDEMPLLQTKLSDLDASHVDRGRAC